MAGNKKQKRKKKKTTRSYQAPVESRKRMSTSQMVFIAFGILIILSMVIGLAANFLAF